MLRKIHSLLKRKHIILSVLLLFVVKIIWSYLLLELSKYLDINTNVINNDIIFDTLSSEFIIVVIIGPIVETLLFQYLFFLILDYFKLDKMWIILISSFAFACIHNYAWIRIFYAFGSGILYGYAYWLSQIKVRYPFLIVLSIHILYNLYAFLVKYT